MSRVELTGGAYTARSLAAAAQRCVNLVPEPIPEAEGEPAKALHFPTPGTRLLNTVGPGPIRGLRQSVTGGIYCVSGNGVYKLDPTTWAGTHLGDLTPGLITPVSMADNGLDLVIVDGSANGWHITLVGDVFAPLLQSGVVTPVTATGTETIVRDGARYTKFTPAFDARITSVSVSLGAGYAGFMKCSIFDADGFAVGDELGSANIRTNPDAGANNLLFASAVPVGRGKDYWVGFVSSEGAGTWNVNNTVVGGYSAQPYADFPANAPVLISATSVVCSIALDSDPGGMFLGGTRVDYLDTLLLFNKPNTPQFYSSDSLALTFDPLWFANKEAYSDLLRTLCVVKRDIWLFGALTTEVWSNVGKPDFPFESQPGIFIDHGIAAKYSVAEYDNGVFWLSADRQGRGIVIMGAGYQTKRISTYAIENEIAGYTRIDDAVGFCYQIGGHSFYVLTFPRADKTWVHDITTGLWHEWLWIDTNGDEHRHRANCYWPVNGVPVVGDWQNGNLYALDHRVFTDNGHPIKRVRSFPHVVNDGKRVFYRQFLADFDTGNTPQADSVTVPTGRWPAGFAALPITGGTRGAVYAVSADGNTVVGFVDGGINACLWTPTSGPISLGAPTDAGAFGVSADGAVIVGMGRIPFRWTAATGAVSFGVTGDNVRAISDDGSRIVGEMNNTSAVQACYWNSTGTVRTPLGFLPGHDRSQAAAVSADGSVIVGSSLLYAGGPTTQRAWRWTAATGLVSLGVTAPATWSVAFDVSADGNTIVGQLAGVTFYGFRWTAAGGMVLMGDPISHAPAISGDAATIMTQNYYPPDPDAYPFNYLGYFTGGELTIPVPAPINPSGHDSGVYPYDGCISGDGLVMAGFTRNTPPGPWVYARDGGHVTVAALNSNLISLRWSDDRGHSYGNPVSQSIGEAGEYRTSLQWQRLGMARDRVWELSWSVPMKCALMGGWFDATPGQS